MSSYCIGALSRASACRIAFHRGELAAQLLDSGCHNGAMMSVGLAVQEATVFLDRLSHVYETTNVAIGCINSPNNVTVTGDKLQMDTLESWFKENSIFTRRLNVGVAYHSTHMNEIADEYSAKISTAGAW